MIHRYSKLTFLLFLVLAFPLKGDVNAKVRRIEAHCLLKDYSAAQMEAEVALAINPKQQSLHEAYISTLAKIGDEQALLKAWKNYLGYFPEQKDNRIIIEKIAWGIIDKASNSSSILTRITALLAAFFSQGTKGVDILFVTMHDTNSALRAAAVELASHLHDYKLHEEIKRLFREEKVWDVRKKVIGAIGSMKIRELSPSLEKLIAADTTPAEEKALAVKAIVSMLEEIDRAKMEALSNSHRAGLRLLACEIGIHLQLKRDQDLFISLTQDYHPEVRAAALQTLGLLRPVSSDLSVFEKLLLDNNPKVALNAAWISTLEGSSNGIPVFEKYLNHTNREIRLYAASAVSSTGHYGSEFALKQLKVHSDPYVKMNLAIGLIGQRMEIPLCGEVLRAGLGLENDKWSWQEKGIFRILTPKSNLADESSEVTPEMENQMTRLEILNVLAMLEDPNALTAIRQFASERTWGISGTASALLLTEGDAEAVNIVKELLLDKNHKIRMQAALILSLWSREEDAIKVLEEGFAQSDRELQIKIIEGLGRIGSMRSVPFLIQILEEPSQIMRMASAMALIQCLNH